MKFPGDQKHWRTIVVGGGQAGLATARELGELGEKVIVLDASTRIGDTWRNRWESLCLFTPAQHDGLPGLPFPAARDAMPSKNEMATYLEGYATHFKIPVCSGCSVESLTRNESRYTLTTTHGEFIADNVVVATGTNPRPRIPEFADQLSASIHQLHSSHYISADKIPRGKVLVVGAGTSGVEIALELSFTHQVFISGKTSPHIPDFLLKYAGELYWQFISRVLTIDTPIGRKVQQKILTGGAPLIGTSAVDLEAANIERVGRVVGVQDARPFLEDNRTLDVTSIIWATGYRPDYSWIDVELENHFGWPFAPRGICVSAPGLYFVGMPFQYGLTSGLVGGVGRDATYISRHIHHRTLPRAS